MTDWLSHAKSETRPADLTPDGDVDWNVPPPDGSPLATFYAWEERRLGAMRVGRAAPFWYGWLPQRSLSTSKREARRLGLDDLEFTAEEVAVRATGGTVVPQGPGTFNITVFTRHDHRPSITEAYAAVCGALAEGFAALGLPTATGPRAGSFCDGDHNILLDGRKLVGTAQRWACTRDGGYIGQHHNAVLTGGDPDWLCGRVEALYGAAGLPESYDRDAHSGVAIPAEPLRAAMDGPLTRVLDWRASAAARAGV